MDRQTWYAIGFGLFSNAASFPNPFAFHFLRTFLILPTTSFSPSFQWEGGPTDRLLYNKIFFTRLFSFRPIYSV